MNWTRNSQRRDILRWSAAGRCLRFALLLSLLIADACQADWPQFRGVNSSGHGSGSPPIEFRPGQNELWQTDLGPGHSSPCIAGDRIFVTTHDAETQTVSVVCLDRRSGSIQWKRDVKVPVLEKGHPSFNPASSSPCCDDECVVAYFGSYGLVCYDHLGNRLWERELPLAMSYGGNATSPMIVENRVILYRATYGDHYLLCLDKRSGEQQWRVDQEEKFTPEMACTACPIVAGDRLICHSARSVQAFEIATGKRAWIAKCATTATSTPILAGNEVIVASWNKLGEPDLRPPFPSWQELLKQHDQDGDESISRDEFPKLWIFHRPEGMEAAQNGAPVSWKYANKNGDQKLDREEWQRTIAELDKFRAGYETHGLIAIPVDSDGFVAAEQVRSLLTVGIPEVPSPVAVGERVYLVKNGGLLTCVDAKSGERVSRTRTRGSGTHYASPLVADNRLYTFAGDGRISVLELGDAPRILAVNEMNEGVFATPAIVDGVIYVRTHSKLFAFGDPNE